LVVLTADKDDLLRVDADTRVIAVDMPNTQYANTQPWWEYRTSVDQIEAATGLDLLDALPLDLQAVLEGAVDAGAVH
jgi:endonuclease G